MTIALKLVAANDTVGALLALADALGGKQAVFVTAPETNGLMPEVHGLPDQVPDHIALIRPRSVVAFSANQLHRWKQRFGALTRG
jgi:hypothetical protein